MAEKTLADINKSLETQTSVLRDQAQTIGQLNSGLSNFLTQMQSNKLKDREGELEKSAAKANASNSAQKASSTGGASGGLLDGIGLGKLFAGGFGLAAGLDALKALGFGLIKRGIPALLLNSFADEIASWVEKETGSAEFGDAIFRGLKLGSLGLLLGRRFGVLGFITGIFLTPENQKALGDLKDTITDTDFRSRIKEIFGVTIPSISALFTSISESFGNTIKLINNALLGKATFWDVEGEDNEGKSFTSSIDDLLIAAGSLFALFRPGGAIRLAIKTLMLPLTAAKAGLRAMTAGLGVGAGAAAAAALTPAEQMDVNREQAKKLSDRQKGKLKKAGFSVNSKGNITDLKGNMVDAQKAATQLEKVGAAPVGKAAGKFPRFAKALRMAKGVAGIGALLSVFDIASILMGPGSDRDKALAIGGSIGALGGSVLGALLGTVVGGPLLGTVVGGALGAYGGDAIGTAFGQYLLGKPIDSLGPMNDWVNGLIGGQTSSPGASSMGQGNMGFETYDSGQAVKPKPKNTQDFVESIDEFTGVTAQAQTSAPVVLQDNSTSTSGTTNQAIVSSIGPTYDLDDPWSRHAFG